MTRLRISAGAIITLGGHNFPYLGQNMDGVLLGRTDDEHHRELIPVPRLLSLIKLERAEIHQPACPPHNDLKGSADPAAIMTLLPTEEFRKTSHRWALVCAVFSLAAEKKVSFTDRSLAENQEEILNRGEQLLRRKAIYRACDQKLSLVFPSTRQLRRWCKRWRNSGGSVFSLVNRRSVARTLPKRWTPDQRRFLDRACEIYLEPKCQHIGIAIRQVQRELQQENEERSRRGEPEIGHISQRAFSNEINQLDAYLVDLERHGRDFALSKHSASVPTENPPFVGARIEIDAVRMDIMNLLTEMGVAGRMTAEELDAVPRVRVTVMMAIDVASRCVLGLYISENEDTAAAIRTLHLVTIDKSSWSQAAGCRLSWDQAVALHDVFSDAGSAFANEVLMRAIAAAGGNLNILIAGAARLRGSCERVFRTINQGFLPLLSGRTFGDVVERGAYDSEANAVHTIDDLTNLLIRFVVDVYHETPTSSLGGLSPREMWDHLVDEAGLSPCPSPKKQRLAFGFCEQRVIDTDGVKIAAIPFNSRELQTAVPRKGKTKVSVYVNPLDLGAVTVEVKGEFIDAFAPDPKFRGVTLDEWVDGHKCIWPTGRSSKDQPVQVALEAIDSIRQHDNAARTRRGLTFNSVSAAGLKEIERRRFFGLSLLEAMRDEEHRSSLLDKELPGRPATRPDGSSSSKIRKNSKDRDTSWWDGDDES